METVWIMTRGGKVRTEMNECGGAKWNIHLGGVEREEAQRQLKKKNPKWNRYLSGLEKGEVGKVVMETLCGTEKGEPSGIVI